jgi:DNA-binding NarL/FixJ family response regulator
MTTTPGKQRPRGDLTGHDGVTLRVLLVDDHQLVRQGLRLLIDRSDAFLTVGEAATAEEALRLARARMPDFVLLDVGLPGQSGIDVLPLLLDTVPDLKVLMLSLEDDPAYVRAALAAGAQGYVLKEAAHTELLTAMTEVASGGYYVHPRLGARLARQDTQSRAPTDGDPLSPRESEVLRLLALGHTNQEIAKLLYISVRTVETHRAHIMKKLDLSSRAELVRYALAHAYIQGA